MQAAASGAYHYALSRYISFAASLAADDRDNTRASSHRSILNYLQMY